LKKDLRNLGIDHADVLILGYYNRKPNPRMLDKIFQLMEKGLIRNVALSSHKRNLFSQLEKEKLLDVIHVRYNAVNRGAEYDVFPFLTGNNRPGIVTYTATRWRQLLNPKRMPIDKNPLKAVDAYRFVLSNPNVDVCMVGAKDKKQMQENLGALELGPLDEEEMNYIRDIGDFIYGKKRIQSPDSQ
jgi:aryl-alcohol dehydrogenase-like predicted oxidoreductase